MMLINDISTDQSIPTYIIIKLINKYITDIMKIFAYQASTN